LFEPAKVTASGVQYAFALQPAEYLTYEDVEIDNNPRPFTSLAAGYEQNNAAYMVAAYWVEGLPSRPVVCYGTLKLIFDPHDLRDKGFDPRGLQMTDLFQLPVAAVERKAYFSIGPFNNAVAKPWNSWLDKLLYGAGLHDAAGQQAVFNSLSTGMARPVPKNADGWYTLRKR
jgi:hypothetical protein